MSEAAFGSSVSLADVVRGMNAQLWLNGVACPFSGAMDMESNRCLFCFEATGVMQVCFCIASCHLACLAQLIAEHGKTTCQVCRRPLRPDILVDCVAHTHKLNVGDLGASHPDTQLSRFNVASSLAYRNACSGCVCACPHVVWPCNCIPDMVYAFLRVFFCVFAVPSENMSETHIYHKSSAVLGEFFYVC